MFYAELVVDNKSVHTDTFYTYASESRLTCGQVVYVPFGKGNRRKLAVVIRPVDSVDPALVKKVKKVLEVDPDLSLSPEMVETAVWMRQRYGIRYLDALRCFLPIKKGAANRKAKDPLGDLEVSRDQPPELTEEQAAAAARIEASLEAQKNEIFLLQGVTSSGKTEVYLRAIAGALKRGRTAIILVPEISLTPQLIGRLAARFGREEIAVLHSRLTYRQRYDEWMRLRRGEARIAVGARIGVFAPLENLGLIILDEEHESTYKSDQTPKYETVDVAAKRLMASNGVMVLGSATPSVVSYQRAQEGTYTLLTMKRRYNRTPLPDVKLVDMREELRAGNYGIFSEALCREMKKNLEGGRQVILFMNRRGFSTFISCRDCGEPLRCPDCGITLVYHKTENAAVCHYCGRKFPLPDRCPECGSRRIRYFGAGTEKVEEAVREMFPDYPAARLDIDTAKNTREIRKILNGFAKGRTRILVGTQLVAKGLDFSNVGLVGVVAADVSLNIPDYRSSERTFQLVTQVAGRAGRGDERGEVIVQSYTPDHFALRAAAHHDYEEFFRKEVQVRQLMDYPPFTDLIAVLFTSEDEQTAKDTASECKTFLVRAGLPNAERILEPKISYFFRGENSWRYHILAKCPRGKRNEYMYRIRQFQDRLVESGRDCSMVADVNPYGTF